AGIWPRGPGTVAPAGARPLLLEVRRPRRVAQTFTLMPCRQLQQALERPGGVLDSRMAIAQLREALGHSGEREIGRVGARHFVPAERRRDPRIGRGPYRVGGGHGPVFGVLVVVHEHAVALFLPTLARRPLGRAAT